MTTVAELAIRNHPHNRELACLVGEQIARENPSLSRGAILAATAVVALHDCKKLSQELSEALGEEITQAVESFHNNTIKSSPLARLAGKLVFQRKYLAAVTQGQFDIAKEHWQKVEACKG